MDTANLFEGQEPIAIIGINCRFPGARNVDEFWRNLCEGVESITFFSDEEALASGVDPALLRNPKFVKAFGVLDDIDLFDAAFFNVPPREAKILDPQHRLFLECAWEVLESAGYNSETYTGRIGVFAGTNLSTYLLRNLLPNHIFNFPTADRLEMALSNHKDVMPMRVSYQMNLTGPSFNVSCTCSTSLVAVHLACQSLWTYESDMALAGGSYIRVPQKEGYLYQEGMIYSTDGHCRTFDAQSKGIVSSNGVGIVVLKRLSDAISDRDSIYAIIRGSAVNNDGSTKVGYTAPSVKGQAEATAQALSLAGITADTIGYVEAHGTGTELGDPVEIASLTRAFRTMASTEGHQQRNYCAIGSVKTNIGHTNHTSGVAGLIKTALTLHHKKIPPMLHFQTPNPKIDFTNSPFYINTTLQEWQTSADPTAPPRRAGVNSFGVGGTNAHVVLEEAPMREPSGAARPWQLLVLSAKTSAALEAATTNLASHLKQHPDLNLADVAYTLQVGRRAFPWRRVVLCQSVEDAITTLEGLQPKQMWTEHAETNPRTTAFMFSGQGAQYINMAHDLYQHEPTFRLHVDQCAEILKTQLGLDLRTLLYPQATEAEAAAQQLQQTAITQPVLFTIEYALAQLWLTWGVRPQAMVGHSIGEYVAACLAGVFSLGDALALVAVRGQMMQQLPAGDMLAVPLSAEELQPLLGEELSLAVINGPTMCVVAGDSAAIAALQQKLAATGCEARPLHTSHAFHSYMMEAIGEPFTAYVHQVKRQPPQLPYLSNVTGTWITAQEATKPDYWAKHLRQTVQFGENLQHLCQDPTQILLEIGPGRTLSSLANQHPAKTAGQAVFTSLRHPQEKQPDLAFLLTTLGKLWLAGAPIDWIGFSSHEQRQRLPLPTYPFERQRYWIDPPQAQANAVEIAQRSIALLSELDTAPQTVLPLAANGAQLGQAAGSARNQTEQAIAEIWQNLLGVDEVNSYDNFFDLGGNSFSAGQLVAQLSRTLTIDLSLANFMSGPTIAELAQQIKPAPPIVASACREQAPPLPLSLVKLQDGAPQSTPLFLVHPLDGYVNLYRELVRSLPAGRTVYAFQASGLAEKTAPLCQVEALATHYLQALQSIQPAGPYLIGGASFGGLVAFEMAQQLQALGQSVESLFLIDTLAKGQPFFDLADQAAVLRFITEHLLRLEHNPVSACDLRAQPVEAQIPYLLARLEKAEQPASTPDATQLQQLVYVISAHYQAMQGYSPRPYSGHFTFFCAQESLPGAALYRPEHFWLDLAQGGIEINRVPGNHFTMHQLPHVQTIAEKLAVSFKQGVERCR